MYYYPWRKGSYPLSMYFYPRRSGNSPRLSGNFLWRMGSYPVSEYFNLCSLPAVRRGASAGMLILLTGIGGLKGMSRSPHWKILGHKSVKTTMIYTHVLNRGGQGVRSPLDVL